ncbi:hypothetical protein BDF20DRAFT_884888 [Mycotypha africana]|uniref:uncharacterized protein n=1 Tax=Mycotypha africana TaxID=64632 RepID=UPI0022FFFD1D|nr:uncharacterized protein BDF20DRAFT_884888 [Mycotypha africana]KAI8971509.1 hypothetical protein BDF20DRAFT_884888 [Mycotypha africana]
MRTIASLALVAAAATVVSSQDCNPSYNVPSSSECFTNCNTQAGSKYVAGWTMDHTSENFLPSLKLMCTKGTSEYLAFMTQAGMCMAKCPDDPTLFSNEFAGACAWYEQHKNDQCGSSAVTTTTGAAPQTTTTANNASPTSPTTPTAGTASASGTNTGASVTTTAAGTGATNAGTPVDNAASPAVTSVSPSAAVPAASNSTAIKPASAAPSAAPSTGSTSNNSASQSAANKLQLSGYAFALIAGAAYLAF